MRRHLDAACAAALFCTAACTGYLEGPDGGSANVSIPATGVVGSASSAPEPGPSDTVVPPQAVACQGEPKLGPSTMRRQTNTEYVRSARALLQADDVALNNLALPGESAVHNFENVAELQSLSEQHVTQFDDVVTRLVTASLANPSARGQLLGCNPTGSERAGCINGFIERFGRRAYRRPLTDAEKIDALALGAVADTDADPYASVALIARGLLGASSALFLVELGGPDPQFPTRPDYSLLRSYELVARGAYLAWGAGPDDWLLDAAASGQIEGADGAAKMATYLLADARARTGQQDFFHRWLRLRDVEQAQRDTTTFPEWGEDLKTSMIDETLRFTDALAWTAGADFRHLLSADYSFLDNRLATLYGLPAPAVEWSKVTFPAAAHRSGLLTQASFLTVTGRIKPKAILRGKLIQEALLCKDLPSPPADIPPLEKAQVSADASDRDRLVAHRSSPVCAGCHQLLDPVGFGLDHFDAIGKYLERDASGHEIDASGTLAGFEPPEFDGAAALAAKLEQSPAFSSCIALQLFRWATARPNTSEDDCAVAKLWASFTAAGYDYRALLSATLQSDAFRHRNVLQP